jgi:caa(3)-type oxidase subunit IV
MTDPHAAAPAMPAHGHDEHAGPRFQDYMNTFFALAVLTAASFGVFWFLGHGMLPLVLIMLLAIVKAALVISIFMHLYFDFRKLYGIIIPVVILCIMSTFIFLVDQVMVWHRLHAQEEQATQQMKK